MSRVRTWINNVTGKHTNRITVRIEHRLSLSDMVSGLASRYGRHVIDGEGLHLPQLSESEILETIKEEYEMCGTNALWTWSDHTDEMYITAIQLWAEDVIIQAFPEMGENRG